MMMNGSTRSARSRVSAGAPCAPGAAAGRARFGGRVCIALLRALVSLHRLRPTAVARHIYDTGITAVPIVSLVGFLISVILAYMGAQELGKFGADIFVVDLVTVGVLRELGVLLTAIIVAGRSGSAFAAEIGAMQLNEEVDALRAIGVDPIEALVVPRVLAMLITLPLLTIAADLIGLVGGGLLCHVLLDMPMVQYLNRVQSTIAETTFWVGLIKAPVFAMLIAGAGCACGMRVRGSSRELGRLTTHGRGGLHLQRHRRRCAVRGGLHEARYLMAALLEVEGIVTRFGTQTVHDGTGHARRAGRSVRRHRRFRHRQIGAAAHDPGPAPTRCRQRALPGPRTDELERGGAVRAQSQLWRDLPGGRAVQRADRAAERAAAHDRAPGPVAANAR